MKGIRKLISGGQTGADQSIVAVAGRVGLALGGVVPKGWRTERGPMPWLADLGFTESESKDYRVRTCLNVEHSDATLVLATDPASDGSRLTVTHANRIGRPCLVVDPFDAMAVDTVRRWLERVGPAVLNVAGNRESRAPGIGRQAEAVLNAALTGLSRAAWCPPRQDR